MSNFSILNIAGLKPQTVPSKVPYVEDLLKDKNQLFIVLSETWLKNHTEAELKIDGYSLYRSDRTGRKHTRGRFSGGVVIYLRADLAATAEEVLKFSNGVVEAVAVYSEKENLFICGIYRQPDDPLGKHTSGVAELNQALQEIGNAIDALEGIPDILLGGDLNIPHANWQASEPSSGNASTNGLYNEMLSLQNKYFLSQMINVPTHRAGNILDLLFTNNQQLINEVHALPSNFSDHYVVEIASHYKSHFARNHQHCREFTNTFDSLNFFSEEVNWAQLRHDMQDIQWDNILEDIDPKDQLSCFHLVCESIAALHVPKKRVVRVKNRTKIPRERRVLMRRRRKVAKQLAKFPSKTVKSRLVNELTNIEMNLQDSYARSLSNQEQKALEAIRTNPKYFFSYVKKFSKSRPSIGPLLNAHKQYVSESAEMAELLSNQYSSVFSQPRESLVDPMTIFNSDDPSKLIDIEITPADFIEAINELAPNAAPGPDCFPALLLKQCKEQLASPLARIWQECLNNGITPDLQKLSLIVPVHKGDSTALAKNYRPVALTSHLVKIFEKVVRRHIVSHLEINDAFNSSQHGFRTGRSCLSQLLAHYDRVLSHLEEGFNVDVIYLDFAKAFDKLDFNITLHKLKLLGIDGKIGRWIHSFLTGRYQRVVVNGAMSNPAAVLSGVPQGSVLGPILFLIMLGDIDKDVAHAFLSSFADDTRVGKSVQNEQDVQILQEDLYKIYEWANLNNMTFNDTKFEMLRYGRNSELIESTTYLSNTGSTIQPKSALKDLGVTMSSSGHFTDHINKITETVRNLSAWILRSFKSRSRILLLQLWKSIVIPRLDYCSQLWNPHNVRAIQQLEDLQKAYIRHITGFYQMNYWDALKELGLYSLQRRRERYQIIYLWSILEAKVPNIISTSGSPLIRTQSEADSRNGRTIRVPTLKRSPFSSLRSHSLPFYGAKLFNSMPRSLRNLTDISKVTFKRELDVWLNNILDQPLIRTYTQYRLANTNSILDMSSTKSGCDRSILDCGST